MDYKRKAHSVYLMTYHIVFVTKYRKPILSEEIGDFIKDLCTRICQDHDGELLSAETPSRYRTEYEKNKV